MFPAATRLSLFSLVFLSISPQLLRADDVDFNRDIKPILSNQCFFCHGPDKAERQGGIDGLRIDTREGATADLGGHVAIAPGDIDASTLLDRVSSTDDGDRMPPPGSGRPLTETEIDLLRRWIDGGAQYAQHWSYVPPVRPAVPAVATVNGSHWPHNPIDHFILVRLQHEGLSPSEVADRYTLIRRLSLDLTGIPPTIQEVDEFVSDTDPSSYEKWVDRLMAKKAYGEHWARLWLDLARYADSAGYADDPLRTIWLYRDYVIQSINENKSFDQFTIEQIAGDLLPGATDQQVIATAFHRNTMTNSEGGTDDEEFRNAAIVDRVNTTLAVWMGTTMACAQCHSHKYDPITQEEYFKLFAILNNTEDADRRDESPLHSVYTAEQESTKSQLETEAEQLKQTLATLTPDLIAERNEWLDDFPRDLAWSPLTVQTASNDSGNEMIVDGSVVAVANAADTDIYRVSASVDPDTRAISLQTLPHESLPGGGPGHGGGNFVITQIHASVTPPDSASPSGRFVRIELPGKQRMLSLAEVEVFSGDKNVATLGKATQSSTGFDGPAELAIDGNTDGRYVDAKSTTHTEISDDPWWELDLQSPHAIDRIVVWNRTDEGTVERLKDFRILVLSDQRKDVWEQVVADPPKPSVELATGGPRPLKFSQAIADYNQSGFDASSVLKPMNDKNKTSHGWAVGGQANKPHRLVLILSPASEIPSGGLLTITIEQKSPHHRHTVGRFQLSTTSDARVKPWASTPPEVLAAVSTAADQRSEAQGKAIDDHFLSIAPSLTKQRKRAADIAKELTDIQPITVPVLRELADGKRRTTRLQHRGNFMSLGDEIQPGTPEIFHPLPPNSAADRMGLAQWLVDDNNPLTPRVVANRYWERLFGTGIVATSEEFGSQGELPSHPELLDWLATELIRLDWDTKAFVKQLVMSAAYRQASNVTAELYEVDPDNRLLARGPRFRLAAEAIRDQALYVAGLMSEKMHGPPVNPPQPSTGLSAAFGSGIDWKTSSGEDRYRRALYTTWRRSNPYPSMSTFDAPNREVCTLKRGRSNTPLQALVTLNDPVFVEAAQGLARRITSGSTSDLRQRMDFGFRLCLARPAEPQELDRLIELYHQSYNDLSKQPDEAKKLATDPLGPLPDGADPIEMAAWTTIANVLLNLDETLMRR
jgi:hypothetical protein